MKQPTPRRPLQWPALATALADAERLMGSLGNLNRSLCKERMNATDRFASNHVIDLIFKCREIRDEMKGAM